MEKKAIYFYNPVTDNFERIYPTFKSKVLKWGGIMLLSMIFGAIFFIVAYYGFADKNEQTLRRENLLLRSQYNVLEKRVESALKIMNQIQKRDDNFYRVMLQMEPLSISRRFAGFDYEKNYAGLRGVSDKGLITQLTQMVDLLDHQLYSQSQSFDKLRENAISSKEKINSVPGAFPIRRDEFEISGGYGIRRDPYSGAQKFHTGIDLSAAQGTEVFSTADGVVTISEKRGAQGNYLEISHGNDYITRYSHLSETLVNNGDRVKRGDLIGKVGSTGSSISDHLHYEVRFKGEAQNPVNFFFLDLSPEEYNELIQQSEDAGNILD